MPADPAQTDCARCRRSRRDIGPCAGRPRPGLRHRLAAGRKAAGGRHGPAGLGADAVRRNRAAPSRSRRLRFDRVSGLQVAQHRSGRSPRRCWNWSGSNSIPAKPPAAARCSLFSHGGALRLDVECLECELTDLGTDDLGTSDLAMARPGARDGAVGRGRGACAGVPGALSRRFSTEMPSARGPVADHPTESASGAAGLTATGRRAIEQGPRLCSQKATMPVRLDSQQRRFRPSDSRIPRRQARGFGRCRARHPRHRR